MTYSFAGFPLPEADVRAVDDGVTVMQDDGEPVTRWRTAECVSVPQKQFIERGTGLFLRRLSTPAIVPVPTPRSAP